MARSNRATHEAAAATQFEDINTKGKAMLELYHGHTSVCAEKARLTLAEKGLEWESHLMALNGDQLDPATEIS